MQGCKGKQEVCLKFLNCPQTLTMLLEIEEDFPPSENRMQMWEASIQFPLKSLLGPAKKVPDLTFSNQI